MLRVVISPLHPSVPLQVMLEIVYCRPSIVLRISQGASLEPNALRHLFLEHVGKLGRRAEPGHSVGIMRSVARLYYEPHGLYVERR